MRIAVVVAVSLLLQGLVGPSRAATVDWPVRAAVLPSAESAALATRRIGPDISPDRGETSHPDGLFLLEAALSSGGAQDAARDACADCPSEDTAPGPGASLSSLPMPAGLLPMLAALAGLAMLWRRRVP